MNITRFGSLNINAADFDATVKFYKDVLNAQVNVRHEVGGVAVARLGLGGVSIGLFDASQGEHGTTLVGETSRIAESR